MKRPHRPRSTFLIATDPRWRSLSLKAWRDFAPLARRVNQREEHGRQVGEFYFADDARRSIYTGTYGQYTEIGSPLALWCELYQEEADYRQALAFWDRIPDRQPAGDQPQRDGEEEE